MAEETEYCEEADIESATKVGMISLGCAKNLVDAEIMLGALVKSGHLITNDPEEADVVIVNTCSFIDAAQEESVETILEVDAIRDAQKRGQGLVVSGCLPQRFRDDLPTLMPEVDAFMGIDQVEEVGSIVDKALVRRSERLEAEIAHGAEAGSTSEDDSSLEEDNQEEGDVPSQLAKLIEENRVAKPSLDVERRPVYVPDYETPRFRLTPQHFAYVKIAEGCNHPCTFCIIPRMRGLHRSRLEADIVAEVRQLIADGVKEINLISQDSTYYGLDLRPNHRPNIASPDRFQEAAIEAAESGSTLSSLLRSLNALEGDFWVRILYTHPAHWTDELIETIRDCDKVANYVDIPLQHIHPMMLERMRRETSKEYIVDLLKRIRKGVPGIAIRTTFIVGFPGEQPAYFEDLLSFIEETRFERLGVFTYSKEDGTLAGKMESQITDEEKQQRRERAMAVQLTISRELASSQVGQEMKVLTEGLADEKALAGAEVRSWEHGLMRDECDDDGTALTGLYTIARGEADAPDIDGRIYIQGEVPASEFVNVRIVGHTDYDLIAELVE